MIKAREAVDKIRRLNGESHLLRRRLDKVSRLEETGLKDAGVERQHLTAEFVRTVRSIERDLVKIEQQAADFRLAASILKNRVRTIDADPTSVAARAAALVRFDLTGERLEGAYARCITASEIGTEIAADARKEGCSVAQ